MDKYKIAPLDGNSDDGDVPQNRNAADVENAIHILDGTFEGIEEDERKNEFLLKIAEWVRVRQPGEAKDGIKSRTQSYASGKALMVINSRNDKHQSLRTRALRSRRMNESRFFDMCAANGVTEKELDAWEKSEYGRRKPLPGHYFELHPVVQSIKVLDTTVPSDYFLQYQAMNRFVMAWKKIFVVTLPLQIVMLPLSFLEATDTTFLLNAHNGTNATAVESPWPAAFSTALNGSLCFTSISLIFLFSIVMLTLNPGALGIVWELSKARICVLYTATVMYTVSAVSILPRFHLVLFLISRAVGMAVLPMADAFRATQKLRMHPTLFERHVGSMKASGRTKWMLAFFLLWTMMDGLRHFLTLFAAENRNNFTLLRITNPATGYVMAITNLQVADATYFTAIFLLAQTLFRGLRRKAGETNIETKLIRVFA